MRYAHEHGLLPPHAVEILVRALTRTQEEYYAGPSYISATSLVGEPMPRQLFRRHGDEVVVDVLDSTWSLFGSALHRVLEYGEGADDLSERRFYSWFPTWEQEPSECCDSPATASEYFTLNGKAEPVVLSCVKCGRPCSWVISGRADLYSADRVIDFKCTSAWALRLEDGEAKSEWEGQLNVLAHLIRKRHWYYEDETDFATRRECEGMPVEGVEVLAFLRDWSAGQAHANTEESQRAGREPDYPLTPIVTVEAPLWSERSAEAFFRSRLAVHSRYDGAATSKVPECSPGMRWHKGDSWAVYKLTAKGERPARASKVFRAERDQTQADAIAYADSIVNKGGRAEVETRPGEDTRCVRVCPVRSFCWFGRTRAVANHFADHAREREMAGMTVQRWLG